MSIGFTWFVNFMTSYPDVGPYKDVVFQVNYSCEASDGTYSYSYVNKCDVKLDADIPFTPYDELTEGQVIGWVKSTLGDDEVTYIQNQTAQQLALIYYKPTVLPNPWDTTLTDQTVIS
jgi:hypothetical protein